MGCHRYQPDPVSTAAESPPTAADASPTRPTYYADALPHEARDNSKVTAQTGNALASSSSTATVGSAATAASQRTP